MRFFSLSENKFYAHWHMQGQSPEATHFNTPDALIPRLSKQSMLCGKSLSHKLKTGIHPCIIQQVQVFSVSL